MSTDVTYIFNVKSDTLTENEATTLVNITLSAIPDVQIAGLLKVTEMEDRKAIIDALKYRKFPEQNPLQKKIQGLAEQYESILRQTIDALDGIADNCEHASTTQELYDLRAKLLEEMAEQ